MICLPGCLGTVSSVCNVVCTKNKYNNVISIYIVLPIDWININKINGIQDAEKKQYSAIVDHFYLLPSTEAMVTCLNASINSAALIFLA